MGTHGRLAGKVALISGAARGMGAAEARRFAAEGACVVLGDVRVDLAREVADEIGADAAAAIALDVRRPDSWADAVALAEDRFGALHVLVNNAGIAGAQKRFTDLTYEEYLETVEIDQHGVFLGMHAAAPAIARAGGGSIVNISSVNGQFGQAFGLPYCAAKFAVRGMTKVAALELGSSGIRVNSIHPGAVDTPMLDADVNGVDPKSMFPYHKLPAGRIGAPEDIANLALFLASDESAYCTGAEFTADGGQTTGIGLPMFRMPTLG